MLVARNQEELIASFDYQKKIQDRLVCPSCGKPVRFKQGSRKIPHFAHVKADCQSFSEGETWEHVEGKRMIMETFPMKQAKLEAYLPNLKQRPDVLWEKRAIEFQCSSLPFVRFLERTENYQRHGYHPWWILGSRFFPTTQLSQFQKACCRLSQSGIHFWCLDVATQRLQKVSLSSWHYQQGISFDIKSWNLKKKWQMSRQQRVAPTAWQARHYRDHLTRKLQRCHKPTLLLQEQLYFRHQSLNTLPDWCYQPSLGYFFFADRMLLLRSFFEAGLPFEEWKEKIQQLNWDWSFPMISQEIVLQKCYLECQVLTQR